MKSVYPIILTPAKEGGYTVFIPDLNINTQGKTVAECIDMARDAAGMWGICQQNMKKEIPAAKSFTPVHRDDEILATVDIDFDAYRRANDMRTVRRNVSLPSYLNEQGEKAGLNFSQLLQEALKSKLQLA